MGKSSGSASRVQSGSSLFRGTLSEVNDLIVHPTFLFDVELLTLQNFPSVAYAWLKFVG
jgi:hypothetical protein